MQMFASNRRPRAGGWGVALCLLGVAGCLLLGFGVLRWPGAGSSGEPAPLVPFRVPEGYTALRVAAPPLITHPMFACFDDQGRLYVAGSSGHNLDAKALTQDPPDVIRCLEDLDGDGHFDKSTVFADHLTYPQGVLWHDGAIYTASPPSLWRLEDTDGDGVADRRQELVTGFPFTGIADDLHGPCLGPDGRIYWGVGRFDYTIRKPGGEVIRKGRTPLIMRCRPDGDEVEVFSAAMGNPVEVAFSPEGEPFACGTFLSPEAQGEGLRDAIIHCVYGGLYSVRDRDLAGEKRTGDLLPPLAQLGVAAGSGMMRARGGSFGDDDHLTLFSAFFNLHSVARHVLERAGATYRADEEPFLASDLADFHPTDVLEDADGSLLVLDTGGWFRSCPTSQVDKPNVEGGIYRLRRVGAEPPEDPRGARIAWRFQTPDELIRLLDDPRFAVRDRAATGLVHRGDSALPLLAELVRHGAPRARLQAVWVLARIASDAARAEVRAAMRDPDERVRLAAVTAAGLNHDARAFERLAEIVQSDTPPIRREAAAALGRLDRTEAVPALIAALRSDPDRFLEHALIFALIRIADPSGTIAGLSDPSPSVRRGALIALDQMDGGRLTVDVVRPLLEASEPSVRQAALRVVARHPEWAGAMAEMLRRWIAEDDQDRAAAHDFRPQLIAFARDPAIQDVITEAVCREATPALRRVRLLEVMAAAPIGAWPATWTDALLKALDDRDERVVRQAIAVIRDSGRTEFEAPLLALARDPSHGDDLRVEALEALAPQLRALDAELFAYLIGRLRPDDPPLRRMAAARTLGLVPLDEGQLMALTRPVGAAGALMLPRLLPAFERSSDPKIGAALVTALGSAPGLRGLAPEDLERLLRIYPEDVRRQAGSLLRRLQPEEEEKAERLKQLAPSLAGGNPRRGREVFFGPRATCSTCHTIGGEGGRVGPDLSRIGASRNGRDLLEAILYPSASFARGYEPFTIATNDGRVLSGIITRETSDAVILVTPDRNELSIPRFSIDEIEPARTSIMPRGLDANLDRQELSDLVAFLLSRK